MSHAAPLLRELVIKGVRLWRDGDKLRFRAPSSVITPEVLAQMREHKGALLALLRAHELLRQVDRWPLERRRRWAARALELDRVRALPIDVAEVIAAAELEGVDDVVAEQMAAAIRARTEKRKALMPAEEAKR